ncbi:MAG TPA: 2-oxoglutarate dehydrogenase, E2 component, dihydrolipoamide succinyltransferase [Actinomycetes bacterium]
MSTSVTMPALGESVSEGTVTRWLKQEGDQVQADEPLLEVSTDKVDTEIPAPASGVLTKIVVAEDETVAVGTELAVIGDADDGGGDGQQAPAEDQQPAQQDQQPAQPAEQPAQQHDEQPAQQQDAEPAQQQDAEQAEQQEQPAAEQAPQQSGGAPSGDSGGSTSVRMPALGESVTEGTVTRWLKQEGDQVQADEALLEVSTDKVDTEIPAPASGVLTKIVVGEDETVAVGTELAVIGGSGGGGGEQAAPQQAAPQQTAPAPSLISAPAPQQAPQPAPQAAQPEQQPAPPQQAAPQAPPAPAPQQAPVHQQAPAPQQAAAGSGDSGGGDPAYVTPLVRKLATEHGVDLATLRGTGVGGRIRKQDVLAAAESAKAAQPAAAVAPGAPTGTSGAPSPLRGTTEKMSRLRKVIAARMVESLQISAQLTTVVEVDLTKVARLRERAKVDFEAREGVKLSFLPFLAKATVEALKVHPRLNASIDTEKGEITYYDAEHLGVAVDTERGLLVPVVKDAGDLNIAGLARKIADLADRTRSNKITPDELGGGTFTLTNTGSRGALFDTPIINQPQVAILGTGAVVKRAVVVDDSELGETIAVRSMCYLALSYDHRLVDGADAARFLTTVKSRLEEGAFESDLGL